jgi:acyl-CoA thioesterase-1
VHNAGVSGDTSAAGLQRFAFTLDGLDRKPDLVLVGLGGNDMLRGLRPEDTQANLDAILRELHRRNIDAMLTGMLAARNLGTDYADRFDPIYPELAKKHDIPLYPFFLEDVAGNRDLMLADGIHPNERGIDVIAGRVAPLVASRLE